MKKILNYWLEILAVLVLVALFSAYILIKDNSVPGVPVKQTEETVEIVEEKQEDPFELFINNLPQYDGSSYSVTVNNGTPFFTDEEINSMYEATDNYCEFGPLDELGRTMGSVAKITPESLCYEKRTESIADLKPSGWVTIRYDDLIEDKYLFNRCHLIPYSSYNSVKNTNVINNLVTGTRYMNLNELDTEVELNEYVELTGHDVLYRATPIYEGNNLVCSGILLEGYGHGTSGIVFQFCKYYFNVQPGITINYSDGSSSRE